MPATPAWPPKSAPRLFIDTPLSPGMTLQIEGGQAHYLAQVMRIREGDAIKLFDDRSGEYPATVTAVAKRAVSVEIGALLRAREAVPDLWLLQAPIKRDRFDWIAEKACELGVARFVPVLTQRCVVDKIRDDRLRAHMIEAAEQCERTALPTIAPLTRLEAMLAAWPTDRTLFFADERLHGSGGALLAAAVAANMGPAAILIGPEGGFTDAENAAIAAAPRAIPVSLGPRILRADTAAAAAVAVWMAIAGD